MSSIKERIEAFVKQEADKIDQLKDLVGPLFSQASFDEYKRQTAAACDAQIKIMLQEDLEETEMRRQLQHQQRMAEVSAYATASSSASSSSSAPSWQYSAPITPHAIQQPTDTLNNYNAHKIVCPYLGCGRIIGNPGSFNRHAQKHESFGHILDPKRRDDPIVRDMKLGGEQSETAEGELPSPHSGGPSSAAAGTRPLLLPAPKRSKGHVLTAPEEVDDSPSDVSQSSQDRLLRQQLQQPLQHHHSSSSAASHVPERGYVGGEARPKKKLIDTKRAQYSVLFKMQAIQKYDEFVAAGKTVDLQATVAKHFDINQSSICRWVRQRKEIEAAYLTAEQDRMRVTMTFKRKSQEITGQFGAVDDYEGGGSEGEAVMGVTGGASSSGSAGALGLPSGYVGSPYASGSGALYPGAEYISVPMHPLSPSQMIPHAMYAYQAGLHSPSQTPHIYQQSIQPPPVQQQQQQQQQQVDSSTSDDTS